LKREGARLAQSAIRRFHLIGMNMRQIKGLSLIFPQKRVPLLRIML
jgi:hypothetical protein